MSGQAGSTASARDDIRHVMRMFPNGVALVTNWVDGRPWGLTVNTFNSASFDPPQVLVSLSRHTASFGAIRQSGHFGISLLSDSQIDVARFGAAPGEPKFLEDYTDDRLAGASPPGVGLSGVGLSGVSLPVLPVAISPMIRGAHRHVDCEVADIFDGGDHGLVLGDVRAVRAGSTDSRVSPLLYYDGTYRHLGRRIRA